MLTARFGRCNRILRDDAAIVFHFHIQSVMRQHPLTELQDPGKTFGGEAMFGVVSDMGLEKDGFAFAGDTAAIDKVFGGVPDFRDMGVRRNLIAIRQNEARKRPGMLGQHRFKIVQSHGKIYIPV